jgi:hypothetical protein
MANGLSKYPLDFDSLTKGHTLTSEKLSEVTGKKPGTDEYRYAVLGLQALIHERTDLTVKIQVDGSLRVLTDPEASDHNHKLLLQALRVVPRRHEMMIHVDVDNLTEEQCKRHDQRLLLQSRYVSAFARETKQIKIEGRKQPEKLTDSD